MNDVLNWLSGSRVDLMISTVNSGKAFAAEKAKVPDLTILYHPWVERCHKAQAIVQWSASKVQRYKCRELRNLEKEPGIPYTLIVKLIKLEFFPLGLGSFSELPKN